MFVEVGTPTWATGLDAQDVQRHPAARYGTVVLQIRGEVDNHIFRAHQLQTVDATIRAAQHGAILEPLACELMVGVHVKANRLDGLLGAGPQ